MPPIETESSPSRSAHSRFVTDREERWDRLEQLLGSAGSRPERLSGADLRQLAALYRATAADLVAARQRFPGDALVERLERSVTRAQAIVYERAASRANLVDFFADGYWRLLWERRRPLGLAAIILIAPALVVLAWAVNSNEAVAGIVPAEFLWVTETNSTDQGMNAVGLTGFSTYVLTNNIRVALTAFVAGMTAGIGTALLVAYNGAIFGALTGLAIGAGNLRLLGEAVLAHGILEFSCIVVAGAAGLSLGRAMLRPGLKTRAEATAAEAKSAFLIAAGTAPWLVLAGFVEGFASRVGLSLVPTAVIGLTVGAMFWIPFVWRGRQIRA